MPGGVLPYQDRYIDRKLKEYMAGFDLRIGTLECAIGTFFPPAPEKLKENGGNNNVCFARDEDFFRVKDLGFNALSLGNNHSFDLGKEGLLNTIRCCRDNGIICFGAGSNLAEASTPAIISFRGQSLCLIGCCIKGLSPISLIAATEDHYGVYQPTIDELVLQIKSLSGKYYKIIVMPHWGEEHIILPPYKCVEYARRIIDAGADAVLGSHSHRVSTSFLYKGKPVYFGLGNYLYPDICLTPPRPFFYPESAEELQSMRRCINYPKSVSQNTVLVWSEDSRIGIAAEATINSQGIKVKQTLVRMGNDNVLCLFKDESRTKNFLLGKVIIPLASFLSTPLMYKFTRRLSWRVAAYLCGRNLGDFKKDI